MGYSQAHKAVTRRKLLKRASQDLRRKGPGRLAVVELMQSAGLTHGGFYAHFESREDLLLKALATVFEEAQKVYERFGDGVPPRLALANFIAHYLSPAHRDRLSKCPIVTLGSDLPRQSRAFRAAFDSGLARLVGIFAGWMDGAGIAGSRVLAASVMSAMAGTLAMSRAIADRDLSDALLAATRDDLKSRLGLG